MIIASQKAPGKPKKPICLRPSAQEGQYIRYRLNLSGEKLAGISLRLGLHPTCTHKVISGQRRSRRIEAEIARILGKADWNDVVLEARSEVQKKPVEVILEERRQAHEEKTKVQKGAFVRHREQNFEEVDRRAREVVAEEERGKQERKLERVARRRAPA